VRACNARLEDTSYPSAWPGSYKHIPLRYTTLYDRESHSSTRLRSKAEPKFSPFSAFSPMPSTFMVSRGCNCPYRWRRLTRMYLPPAASPCPSLCPRGRMFRRYVGQRACIGRPGVTTRGYVRPRPAPLIKQSRASPPSHLVDAISRPQPDAIRSTRAR